MDQATEPGQAVLGEGNEWLQQSGRAISERADERSRNRSQNADTDMYIACMEALLAENELLRCEKAASDALVSELMAV